MCCSPKRTKRRSGTKTDRRSTMRNCHHSGNSSSWSCSGTLSHWGNLSHLGTLSHWDMCCLQVCMCRYSCNHPYRIVWHRCSRSVRSYRHMNRRRPALGTEPRMCRQWYHRSSRFRRRRELQERDPYCPQLLPSSSSCSSYSRLRRRLRQGSGRSSMHSDTCSSAWSLRRIRPMRDTHSCCPVR